MSRKDVRTDVSQLEPPDSAFKMAEFYSNEELQRQLPCRIICWSSNRAATHAGRHYKNEEHLDISALDCCGKQTACTRINPRAPKKRREGREQEQDDVTSKDEWSGSWLTRYS